MVRADQPLLVLEALEGPCTGQRATKQSAKFVVGRRKNLGLHLNDSAVSERHAEVVWGGDGYVLRDLGSSNGTYRNGEVVGAGTPRPAEPCIQQRISSRGRVGFALPALRAAGFSGGPPPSCGE